MPERTAQEVINIFARLGLPVCDDAGAIDRKINSQRDRYTRDKNRSTDPAVRQRANEWFREVADLQSRRPEFLRVVYQFFGDLAQAALSAGMAAGVKTLTRQLQQNLLKIAFRQCHTDDALASRFLKDFMQDHGLKEGEQVARPAPIERFNAESRLGEVALQWTVPTQNCDEIEIIRDEEPSQPGDAGRKIYRGQGTAFVDRDVTPGTTYRYRAHAICAGFEGADTVARGVCMGEVRKESAVWKDGVIGLGWEPPNPDVSVMIFKKAGGPPEIKSSPQGPEPADGRTTRPLHGGGIRTWSDTEVVEGVTYYYRIVVDFGGGLFSKGVDLHLTVPKPPPPVPSVTATFKANPGKDVVALQWQPVTGGVPVDYVVVRREGNAPPGKIQEGALISETPQTQCLDDKVVAGMRYRYAVFTRAGGALSRGGTVAPPVDILAEVTSLGARTGEETVELFWQTPLNAKGEAACNVVVRRGLKPLHDHTDGEPVKLAGPGNAKDEKLQNGQAYHYLVCCVYRPEGGSEVFTPGVSISAVPERLPDTVPDFAVAARGEEVVCTWTPPAYGQAVVLRSAKPHDLPLGRRLEAHILDQLGDRITATASGQAIDPQPTFSKPFYSVFSVAGTYASAGGSAACVICPDVTDLKVVGTPTGVVLRWTWPERCTAVRIARQEGDWPEGPEDPQAACLSCTRSEYSAAGELFIDTMYAKRGQFHYIVFAQPVGAPGLFFAPGDGPSCRAVLRWEAWTTVRYRLSTPAEVTLKNKEVLWTGSVEKPFADFGGLVLVANQEHVPDDPGDGIILARWKPKEGEPQNSFRVGVSLAPILQHGWSRFFCKALAADPTQRDVILIIHPYTPTPISATGEVPVHQARPEHPPFHRGAPRRVICPVCFEKFQPHKILYTSATGGEPVPGRYTWFDRLLRRPPRPPLDERGEPLTRKLCPHKHALPFTAGTQTSLVLGLIGAKFSGKSHYIASLVQCLEDRVSNDLQAALLPLTDETPERYRREFYDPLFKNRLELGLTVGTPPPLIYDLTLDGKLWGERNNRGKRNNRSVALALYDTAGENFDNPAAVQQMVKYVRVASGIMLLIDPLQFREVREALPDTIQLPEVEDPNAILGRVLKELEEGKVLIENAPLATPMAVVVTKCDVLRDAGLIAANRLWSTDTRHIGFFNSEAQEDMSGMMGEYLQRWCPAVYHTIAQRFTRFAFFGVSATGCASDANTRRYKYISPWRVEDPLLWLLAEVGVLPSR